MQPFELIVIGLMIALNSVFAAYEIALASISLPRLESLQRENRSGARRALQMKRRMEASLAVVQLGITLVSATAAATGGAGAEAAIEPSLRDAGFSEATSQLLAIVLVVAPLTAVTIVAGELVPKVFALRNKERVSLALSPTMYWFSWSVWPAVWLLERAVEGIIRVAGGRRADDGPSDAAVRELREAATFARMSRLIGPREESIIVNASRLAATPLREVMLPASYIGMLPLELDLSQALEAARDAMHTRFPVTNRRGDPQGIVGYVNIKDIVSTIQQGAASAALDSLVRPLPRFRDDATTSDCLEQMIRERRHMALVHDAGEKVVGLVTLEDIVEELVGEIYDEFDRTPSHLTRLGRGWSAGGFVSLEQLREVVGVDLSALSDEPLATLSEWIEDRLGRPPRNGDEIREATFHLVVRKVRHTLVQDAFLVKLDAPEDVVAATEIS
ncbi:MAG: HlyC/CorC family transporter [Planctomycetales bacterium]|nr:HlyC/CorC family transporter [Planctomycetales bacterium]